MLEDIDAGCQREMIDLMQAAHGNPQHDVVRPQCCAEPGDELSGAVELHVPRGAQTARSAT